MKEEIQKLFIKQLTEIHQEYLKLREEAIERSEESSRRSSTIFVSGFRPYLYDDDYNRMVTRIRAAIKRIVGSESEYYNRVILLTERTRPASLFENLDEVIGVLEALLEDLKSGYLETLHEIIQANLFSDFMKQAEYLLVEGYKDAAAVIAGSTLEQHLRKLCEKHSINLKKSKGDSFVSKGMGELKDELAREKVVPSSDINLLTSWIQIRNKAAHGEYNSYNKDEVSLMIQGINLIISKYKA